MRILSDNQIFIFQKYGGISRYFYELQKQINDGDTDKFVIPRRAFKNAYMNKGNESGFYSKLPSKITTALNLVEAEISKCHTSLLLSRDNYDIFHPTYYDPYFLRFLKTPFVLTVYDMIHELHPEYFRKKDKVSEWKQLLILKSSKIITISQSTKSDLLKLFRVPEDKIEVIYLASTLKMTATQYPRFVEGKYILYMGTRSGYKNFSFLINNIAKFLLNAQVKLLCVGGGSFSKMENDHIIKLGLASLVLQKDVDDTLLESIYFNAEFLLFPSLYEGFGIPIIEAFAMGCPVLCSDTPVFREVAGIHATYFKLGDRKDLIDKCYLQLTVQNNDRRRLSKSLVKASMKYNWNTTATQTLNVYKSLV